MILGLAFFINGSLNPHDYAEFIRTNSLSYEHLISAKHFLQLEFLFHESTETELMKWYFEIVEHILNRTMSQSGNNFGDRHNTILSSTLNDEISSALKYYDFMNAVVIAKIRQFQQTIKNEIRYL